MGFFQNTCKPEGLGGKIMVTTMNIGGHAALAKWGLSHLTLINDLDIREIGCGGEANVAQLLKRCPNGKVTGVDYAEAPYFAKAFEKYGAACAFHIGPGLCHCYPAASFCPEGKQAQEEIIGLLRK